MPTARMKPVKQEVNEAGTARQTNIFTIQAGRILEISVDTGTVKEVLNLCKAGYFMGIQSEDHALAMLNSQLAQPGIPSSVNTALTEKSNWSLTCPRETCFSGLQVRVVSKSPSPKSTIRKVKDVGFMYDEGRGQGCSTRCRILSVVPVRVQ